MGTGRRVGLAWGSRSVGAASAHAEDHAVAVGPSEAALAEAVGGDRARVDLVAPRRQGRLQGQAPGRLARRAAQPRRRAGALARDELRAREPLALLAELADRDLDPRET